MAAVSYQGAYCIIGPADLLHVLADYLLYYCSGSLPTLFIMQSWEVCLQRNPYSNPAVSGGGVPCTNAEEGLILKSGRSASSGLFWMCQCVSTQHHVTMVAPLQADLNENCTFCLGLNRSLPWLHEQHDTKAARYLISPVHLRGQLMQQDLMLPHNEEA